LHGGTAPNTNWFIVVFGHTERVTGQSTQRIRVVPEDAADDSASRVEAESNDRRFGFLYGYFSVLNSRVARERLDPKRYGELTHTNLLAP
jgi:hypothetical protein